jgi:hypothetical protein
MSLIRGTLRRRTLPFVALAAMPTIATLARRLKPAYLDTMTEMPKTTAPAKAAAASAARAR